MDTHVATHELAITRRIPAPPEAVFAAWTQAERVKAWWGPYGMTTPEAEIDLRPGGIHRTVMQDAAGKTYRNSGVIDEVAAPHHLVMRMPEEDGGPVAGASMRVEFVPEDGGTRVDVRWRHPTAEIRAAHQAMGFEKGWGETLDKLTAHVLTPASSDCPMSTPLSPEHGWLHRMLGTWRFETEAVVPPGQPPMRAEGIERVRSLGGFWVVGEGEGGIPGGSGTMRMVISMGFDPKARRFRGTWVGSMMPHMFVYDGALSEDGRTLTLDTEGPSFDGQGTARYRDIVEMVSDDHRLLRSEVQGPDGAWTVIMTGTYRRQG
jgi:uncharacterized protein YndB with AHSA1/START domain